jgi:2,3-bisphosphoglycerate-independent phosphoglycerate mutase
MMTKKTLYLLVSFSIDETRQAFLNETVSSIKNEIESKHLEPLIDDFVARSYEILKDHPVNKQRVEQSLPPANIVLTRGAASLSRCGASPSG